MRGLLLVRLLGAAALVTSFQPATVPFAARDRQRSISGPSTLGGPLAPALRLRGRSDLGRSACIASMAAQGSGVGVPAPEPPVRIEQLPESVVYLFDEATRAHVYIVGTFHISAVSAEDVRTTMNLTKPSVVMLELCPSRFVNMLAETKPAQAPPHDTGDASSPTARARADQTESTQVVARVLGGVYSAFAKAGLRPGREFETAYEEATRLGARLVLGDADAFDTMDNLANIGNLRASNTARAWTSLARAFCPFPGEGGGGGGRVNIFSLFAQPKRLSEVAPIFGPVFVLGTALGALVWAIEPLVGVAEEAHRAADDVLFAIPLAVMAFLTPRLYEVLIGARDEYLLGSLLECCQLSAPAVGGGGVKTLSWALWGCCT